MCTEPGGYLLGHLWGSLCVFGSLCGAACRHPHHLRQLSPAWGLDPDTVTLVRVWFLTGSLILPVSLSSNTVSAFICVATRPNAITYGSDSAAVGEIRSGDAPTRRQATCLPASSLSLHPCPFVDSLLPDTSPHLGPHPCFPFHVWVINVSSAFLDMDSLTMWRIL